MRVAIVTSSYWPIVGGQMIYARDLAQELVRQGHSVTVVTRFTKRLAKNTWESLSGVEGPADYAENGVQVRVIRPPGLRRAYLLPVHRLHYYERTETMAMRLFGAALTEELDRAIGPCDVVHFNGVGRELLGFCAEAVARRRRVPFVLTTHMHPGTWGDSRLDFRLYHRANRILAHTHWERGVYIAGGVDPSRVTVVGIGVPWAGPGNRERARSKYGLDGPTVMFMARKAHYKGYGLLLESAPIVWKTNPSVRFVFVGPDQDEPTSAQRRILQDRRIVPLGTVTDGPDKADLYAACDVFCMPSTAESFGIVYIEAWQQQRPVIALALPALRELIEGCGGGITVESAQPEAVAGAIDRLLGDEAGRDAMGKAGYQRALEFRLDAVARRIAAIYADEGAKQEEEEGRLACARS